LKCPTVKWSGIQNVLEESQSDVLLLLDCCHAGSANTNEGNGVTEVISACPYNSNANGVGPYSFTHALVIELEALASRAEFSTGELYNNIYCRTQIRLPEDGAGTERHPPPIHLVLSNDSKFRRSIHLARRLSRGSSGTKPSTLEANEAPLEENNTRKPSETSSTLDKGEDHKDESISSSTNEIRTLKEVPRLALAIRFNENLRLEDLSTDLFIEWLRTMPVVAQQVRVEAGFDSFSSLLIVSIPISLSAYLSYNPAVSCLGPITSSNLVVPVPRRPSETLVAEAYEGHISDDVVAFTGSSGLKGPREIMMERAAREQKWKEEQEEDRSEVDGGTIFHDSALGTEIGYPRQRRRNSDALSIPSSLSTRTIASVDSDELPPETNPLSRSPEIYPADSAQNSDESSTKQYPATSSAGDSSTASGSGNGLSKHEVGWYFIEQYYTTLIKSPEKLHLFYGKRSQFVSGLEGEVVPVSVGRSAIQERIKQLDFQDCKVHVLSVDSQASFDNIFIQVIGETSNKSAKLRKFVQTFVLAPQPTGYFVLNDIFRYIN
jgi:hypothetical protein